MTCRQRLAVLLEAVGQEEAACAPQLQQDCDRLCSCIRDTGAALSALVQGSGQTLRVGRELSDDDAAVQGMQVRCLCLCLCLFHDCDGSCRNWRWRMRLLRRPSAPCAAWTCP